MAKNTRQRRRQRRAREKAGDEQQPGVASRARTRQQQVRPAAQPPKTQTGARRAPGRGARRFIGECWAELKKVDWPNQSQVMQGTIVVIIACAIVGAYLWGVDLALKAFTRDFLLK